MAESQALSVDASEVLEMAAAWRAAGFRRFLPVANRATG